MSFPVARAATRFIVKRLATEIKEKDSTYEDLMLITGVGVHHQSLATTDDMNDLLEVTDDNTDIDEVPGGGFIEARPPMQRLGTTALREYVRQVLREDSFGNPIYSVVNERTPGMVIVKKDMFKKWCESYEIP